MHAYNGVFTSLGLASFVLCFCKG